MTNRKLLLLLNSDETSKSHPHTKTTRLPSSKYLTTSHFTQSKQQPTIILPQKTPPSLNNFTQPPKPQATPSPLLHTTNIRRRLSDISHPSKWVVILGSFSDSQVADVQPTNIKHRYLKVHSDWTDLLPDETRDRLR